MKKTLLMILNVIGYISIIALAYFALIFVMIFHDIVKIITVIALIVIIMVQVFHYKKTKIKYFGIRILTSILLLYVASILIRSSFGIIMESQAKKISENIDKIVYEETVFDESMEQVIDGRDLINSISFVNTKHPLIKTSSSDATIYYKDGRTEKTKIYVFEGLIFIGNYAYRLNDLL